MASTTTTLVTLRVPNEDVRALRQLAGQLDVPTSTLGAACITRALAEQETDRTIARVSEALALLERAQRSDHRERRQLVLEALACLNERSERP